MIWDAIIAGAGPAGSVSAYILARAGKKVLILDRIDENRHKIGESLPAAALRLLRSLDLVTPDRSGWHRRITGNASCWGSEELLLSDSINDPDGPGWRLDRHHFDREMRQAALDAGATIHPFHVLKANRSNLVWTIKTRDGQKHLASWLIDATGRQSFVAHSLGLTRKRDSRLVALYALGKPSPGAHFERTVVEAVAQGWWYAAILPSRIPIAGLHLRPEAAAGIERNQVAWQKAWLETKHVRHLFPGICESQRLKPVDAGGGRLVRCAGDGWLACGDAALAFDPLSSQGILSALYGGMLAGRAVVSELSGIPTAEKYEAKLTAIWHKYQGRAKSMYRQESRWPEEQFWAAAQ
jgi:flavin-dependent dehydrogenase